MIYVVFCRWWRFGFESVHGAGRGPEGVVGMGGASQPKANFFNRTMMMSWHKVQTSQHRRNIKRYHFFHYLGFYHKVGEVGIINYYISVTSVTSVKSSLGIITHQGHISQVSAKVSMTQWSTSLLERLVTLKIILLFKIGAFTLIQKKAPSYRKRHLLNIYWSHGNIL